MFIRKAELWYYIRVNWAYDMQDVEKDYSGINWFYDIYLLRASSAGWLI